jgi:hypothetical protein
VTASGQTVELALEQLDLRLARKEPALPLDIGSFEDCAQPPVPSDPDGLGRR